MSDVRAAARAWVAEDPDDGTRAELQRLLDDSGPAAAAELADRFNGRLSFGTAGLRGEVGAGPNRMNRAVVRAATAALARWLGEKRPGSEKAGVVVGCDARHGSADFADEAAACLTGAGFRVHLLDRRQPTPLLAFSVRHLGAAAGVMVTASHNPAADNGYKLYLDDGAQIIPPVDAEIEARISEITHLSDIPTGDLSGPLVVRHGDDVLHAYLDAIAALSPAPPGAESLRVVYTPLHGVAGGVFCAALERAGFPRPAVVPEQAEPDPDFPTLRFPNPEEPGALDLALAEARRCGADVVVANDPDGDRLAVAVPVPSADGGWRLLSGDEVGALLSAYVLEEAAGLEEPYRRLVATTIVSSSLLSKIAAAAGALYAETLTGFKWIVRASLGFPGSRFVFGYEEALGYAVGGVVRDKDGISAALCFLAFLTRARQRGSSVLAALDELHARHGVHLTSQLSLRTDSAGEAMGRLRAAPPADLGGLAVVGAVDLSGGLPPSGEHPLGLPPSDVLVYHLAGGARVVVRPSGTEPKLKVYLEVVKPMAGSLDDARRLASDELSGLRRGVEMLLGP
jgi:phosphomannomutase